MSELGSFQKGERRAVSARFGHDGNRGAGRARAGVTHGHPMGWQPGLSWASAAGGKHRRAALLRTKSEGDDGVRTGKKMEGDGSKRSPG